MFTAALMYKTYVKINEDLTLIGICSSALGEIYMLSLAIWKLGQ